MNDLSEENVIRWIGKLFGIGIFAKGNFHRWATARQYMYEHVPSSALPEGLVDAELVPGRFNLLGAVWNMNSRSRLWELGREVLDVDGCGYLLVADAGLSGAESLFLAALNRDTNMRDTIEDNMYHFNEWANLSLGSRGTGEVPSIVSGGLNLKDGSHYTVMAVRLSSLKQAYGLGEDAASV